MLFANVCGADGGGVLVRVAREEIDIVLDLVINPAAELVLIQALRRGHDAVGGIRQCDTPGAYRDVMSVSWIPGTVPVWQITFSVPLQFICWREKLPSPFWTVVAGS